MSEPDDVTGPDPTISVVIPAYNRAATLPDALSSVLTQTLDEFEVIVVDDGSKDGTAEVARAASDGRVRVVEHVTNKGAPAARNTGIAAARGRYVAFLDSDDRWLPRKLETQLDRLCRAPEIERASCTGFVLTRGPGESPAEYRPDWETVEPESLLDGCFFGPGSTLMAERSVFRDVGPFDESLPRLEDWDWCLRYTQDYVLGFLSEVMTEVRVGKRPALEVVMESTRLLRQKHESTISSAGGGAGLRRFRSSLLLEQAVHAAYERRLTTLFLVAHAAVTSPARMLPFARRLKERFAGIRYLDQP